MTIAIPDDLATEEVRTLVLTAAERDLLKQAQRELLEDRRFEYLKERDAREEILRFASRSFLDRGSDHAAGLVSRLARDPVEPSCCFPLLYLNVTDPHEIAGALLLPLGDRRIPKADRLDVAPPCGGVVSVQTRGTNPGLMMQRARDQAEHALRVLRIALRKHMALNDRQLWFHLGETYAFDERSVGWRIRADAPFEGVLTPDMWQLIERSYSPRVEGCCRWSTATPTRPSAPSHSKGR